MKLGDFFVEIGIQTDKKSVKAIDEQIKALKELEEQINTEIKKEKELAEAQTEEQKARIKKKYETKEEIKLLQKQQTQQKASIANFRGMIKGIVGVAVATGTMVFAFDRMITRLAMANQKLVNFQQQTGISFRTLNKYASANVSANPLTSIESTAGSLQNLAQNLWDIQLGRGDVSAFQELSYFSGMNVTPYGKSVEEVIESVRSALTKIPNDVQATNLIQRMGFSADDLQMLRMTREEFEKTQDLFLNASQRKELEYYGKQLNVIHLRIKKIVDLFKLQVTKIVFNIVKPIIDDVKVLITGFKAIYTYLDKIVNLGERLKHFIAGIIGAVMGLMAILAPQAFIWTSLFLIIDDFLHYISGGGSVIGDLIEKFKDFKIDDIGIVKSIRNIGNAVNTYFKGIGFANLEKLLGLFLAPIPVGASLLANNLTPNYVNQVSNDNRNNTITINTNNPNVSTSAIVAVTGQNYTRGGGK